MKRTLLFILTYFISWPFGLAVAAADEGKTKIDLIDSLNAVGSEFIRSNPDSAFIVLQTSHRLARAEDYRQGMALSAFLLGNFLQNRGRMEMAYQHFYQALQINLELDDKASLAECYNSIGDLFRRQQNFREASKNYNQSLELAQLLKDTFLIAENINNHGDVFRDRQDYETAIIHYEKALEYDQKIDNVFGITDGYNNLGDVYLYLNNYEEAREYFNKSLRLAESVDNQLEIADNLNKLGIVYSRLGDYETALFFSRLAATVSNRIRLTEELMEAYRNLTDIYQHLNRYDKALESHRLFTQFQDSLMGARAVRQISELQHVYESEKKDNEIMLQEAQLEKQSLQLKWLATALILLSIIAFIFYRNFLTKQRVNRKLLLQQEEIQHQKIRLEEKNKMLRKTNEEKNEIIGMVAHDLRAPINQVLSVVNLMDYEKEKFSEDMLAYLKILDTSTSRMKFMVSEILNIEAIENSSFELDMKPVNLPGIIEEEVQNFRLYADKKQLRLDIQIETPGACARIDPNIYRNILENLISNAVKYSPGGRAVCVKLAGKENHIITSVKDEGPGLSQEDMTRVFGKYQKLSAKPTGGEDSIGLGLSLVKKFTEAMGGKVWCQSEIGRGAEFFVSFEKCISKN